jgi:chloramphenicol 3-O-phosphotransferase
MTDNRAAIILLVGQKGAGKTTIGERLAHLSGIIFLRVEPIYLSVLQANPNLSPKEIEPIGFGAILDAVEELARHSPVICMETTGTAGYFPEFLRRLQAGYRLHTVRVGAPAEVCLERVRRRDQTNHIPVSDERVREINRIAAKVSLEWSLEVDNPEDGDLDLIAEAIARLLKTGQGG